MIKHIDTHQHHVFRNGVLKLWEATTTEVHNKKFHCDVFVERQDETIEIKFHFAHLIGNLESLEQLAQHSIHGVLQQENSSNSIFFLAREEGIFLPADGIIKLNLGKSYSKLTVFGRIINGFLIAKYREQKFDFFCKNTWTNNGVNAGIGHLL